MSSKPAPFQVNQRVTVADPGNPHATCTGTVLAVDARRGTLTVHLDKSRLRDADAGENVLVHPRDWHIVGTP
jgi:hypothetical protein